MYYFFDESGNWEEIDKEKRKLVIAGMVVKDQKTVLQLRDKVKKFKQQYNIKEIHATTLRSNNQQDALGRLYEMIYTFIQQGHIKVLAYVVQPSSLKTTRKSNEEIYIDFASDIISEICFGDRDIDIDYDMKFRYAYPKNIIDHINTNTINPKAVTGVRPLFLSGITSCSRYFTEISSRFAISPIRTGPFSKCCARSSIIRVPYRLLVDSFISTPPGQAAAFSLQRGDMARSLSTARGNSSRTKAISSAVFPDSRVNTTEPWAKSAGTPMATSTGDVLRAFDAQAEPVFA
jgi:hypothetical protein